MKAGVATLVNEFTAAGPSADTAVAVARLASLVAESPRVAAALTRSDLPLANKTGLVSDLGSLDERSAQLVAKVCDYARRSDELAEMLLAVAAHVCFAGADTARVENELYAFGAAVRSNSQLRQTLGAPGVPTTPKQEIVDELLAGKADTPTIALLKAAVAVHEGRDMDRVAFNLSDQAAEASGRSVAHVTTAIELDDERRNSLTAAVQRIAGKPVQTRFDVSPKIVGSVVVRIGDDVYDGSVSHRLDQARQKLVGAR